QRMDSVEPDGAVADRRRRVRLASVPRDGGLILNAGKETRPLPSIGSGLLRLIDAGAGYFGISTVSMTWTTPLDWATSACVIMALPPLASVISHLPPPMSLAVSFSP